MSEQEFGSTAGSEQQADPQLEFLQQMIKENEFLQRENLLLEAYLSKIDFQKAGIDVEEELSRKKKNAKKKIDGPKTSNALHRLNDDEKNDLVSLEVELVQTEIEQLKQAGDKDIDDIRTLMEEVDMRIADTKKDTYEFKRDIIVGAENPRTGKIIGEKMVRFLEEKLRQKDTTIEKLRLKNSTIKANIAKTEQMLAHKEEMGEVLHLVDFDQLKIENQQYLEKIEERNNELLRLKLSTSRTVQVLNGLKSSLHDGVIAGQNIRKTITERKSELAKLEGDIVSVADERTVAERTTRRLKVEQEDVDNPSIMDYIRLKHEVGEMEKHVHDWQRKIEILGMEQKRTRQVLKSMGVSAREIGGPGALSFKSDSARAAGTRQG